MFNYYYYPTGKGSTKIIKLVQGIHKEIAKYRTAVKQIIIIDKSILIITYTKINMAYKSKNMITSWSIAYQHYA